MEILCVSSTNKRVISLLNYCSLLYINLYYCFFLRPRYNYGDSFFSASKRKLNNLGTLGDAPH